MVELRFTSPTLKLKVKHTAFAGNHILCDLLLFYILALVLLFQGCLAPALECDFSATCWIILRTTTDNGALLQRGSLCSLEEILNKLPHGQYPVLNSILTSGAEQLNFYFLDIFMILGGLYLHYIQSAPLMMLINDTYVLLAFIIKR